VTLNWKSVSADHVQAALKQVANTTAKDCTSGLIVFDGNRKLPAKEVLGVAYRLANKLASDVALKFSSGDGTLHTLQRLGFRAERIQRAGNKVE
jgi:hypothetical protein